LQSTRAKTDFISGNETFELADHYAPDLQLHAFLDLKCRVTGILCDQSDPTGAAMEAFDEALAIHERDDDVAVSSTDASIDDQDVAIENLRTLHAVAFNGKEEGRDRIPDKVLVDVESLVLIVGGWGREAGRDLDGIER